MKKNTRKGFIYFRYIFPMVVAVMLVALMFVPCYTYITADTGVNEAISLWELLGNSWKTAREYLFGSGEKYEVTMNFARTLLALVVTLSLLFVLGVAIAVYSAVCVFRYIANGAQESKERIFFITLVPNRIVLCVFYALMLPIFMLPMLMHVLYKSFLSYQTQLSVSPFDMLFAALALYLAVVVVTAISAEQERMAEVNIFIKRKAFEAEVEPPYENDELDEEEITDPYELMSRKEKAEQTERILRMLGRYNEENEKEDNE